MIDMATVAIQQSLAAKATFCKFLSSNDTGKTGGHQAGIYISKPSISILFDTPGERGTNKDKWVRIKWQNDFETDTRFTYYGQGTRNEYRITNFGRGFPLLKPEYTGALFILTQQDDENYSAFVLNSDDEITSYLDAFGISPTETNRLIETEHTTSEYREQKAIEDFIAGLCVDFPASEEMSLAARKIYYSVVAGKSTNATADQKLLKWTEEEFKLFRALEYSRYGSIITKGFSSVDQFVVVANQVLNRRKSRAGKSLEHHLSAIFDENNILYSSQAVTEGNKRPDFIFPSEANYHDMLFPTHKLISLAAKPTCKDRWRQVINEADRLRGREKYLCTLQQGVSAAQMDEMQEEKVILVVPQPYISTYPKDRQDRIWTIEKFVSYVREMESV